jgi:squalene cyclase
LALARAQRPDGMWDATWYVGTAYGTSLCLQLLRAVDSGRDAVTRACAALRATQRGDGAWGAGAPEAMETAFSLWALGTTADDGHAAVRERGAAALVALQAPDGSWPLAPWIRMPIGRATGQVTRVATYQSVTITTAFCLRSLVAAREALDRPAGPSTH